MSHARAVVFKSPASPDFPGEPSPMAQVLQEVRGLLEAAERNNGVVAYTYEVAAEKLTGRPYGSPGCLSTDVIARLVTRGYLTRVPHIGKRLVTRKSVEHLAALGVPEI